MVPRLELYAFRYRDPRTGKWTTERYRAERHEIAARYAEWEIIGPPEIRNVDPDARYFTPHRREARSCVSNLGPVLEIAGCVLNGIRPYGHRPIGSKLRRRTPSTLSAAYLRTVDGGNAAILLKNSNSGYSESTSKNFDLSERPRIDDRHSVGLRRSPENSST